MITDSETNLVWFSERLKSYQPFFNDLTATLDSQSVCWKLLPFTKDVWAKDYMPVQVAKNSFLQFRYDPDYLKPKIYCKLRTNPAPVCAAIKIQCAHSDTVVDGGNIVRGPGRVIVTSKVFAENPTIPENTLIRKLADELQVEQIIIVPWDEQNDFTGHADGIVRFIDSGNVLINNYRATDSAFALALRQALSRAGLICHEIPYNPYKNETRDEANGIYINFLQVQNTVFVPVFGLSEDDDAIKRLQGFFPKVIPVQSNLIAKEGGVLNCISWNIYSE